LSELTSEELKVFRGQLIKLVLATDLAHSFEYLSKFKNKLSGDALETADPTTPENKLLLMQIILKCSDVGHPAKTWKLHARWSDLIMEEFFQQGDQEKEMNLPVSMLCDRGNVELPKSQQGFIQFVVRPIFQPLADFCNRGVYVPPADGEDVPPKPEPPANMAGNVWMGIISENTDRWKVMQAEREAVQKAAEDAARVLRVSEGDGDEASTPDPAA